jgi:CheY-like chemotaxis protein
VSGPENFLIVDDDPDSRYLNAWALKKAFAGCTVIEASSAEEGLQKAGGVPLTGVLTDHHLRGETGVEFVEALRRGGFTCPVVVITGSTDPRVEEAAYRAGASRVISSMNPNLSDCLKDSFRA